MVAPLWTSDESDLLKIWLLEWIGTYQHSGRIPPVSAFIDGADGIDSGLHSASHVEQDLDSVVEALRALRHENLIDGESSLAGMSTFGARLTPVGVRRLTEVTNAHGNRRLRNKAARDALLDWMYETTSPLTDESREFKEFRGSTHAHVLGSPFTEDEVLRAARFLRDEQFITGVRVDDSVLLRPKVTAKGQAAVEREQYTSETEPTQSTTTTHNTVNVGGDVHGQAAAGTEVHQVQQIRLDQQARPMIDDVRKSFATLPDEQVAVAEAYLQMLTLNVGAEHQDRSLIETACRQLKTIADKAATATMGVGVDVLWRYLADRLGFEGP